MSDQLFPVGVMIFAAVLASPGATYAHSNIAAKGRLLNYEWRCRAIAAEYRMERLSFQIARGIA